MTTYHVRTFESEFQEYPNDKISTDNLLIKRSAIENSVYSYLNLFEYQYPNPLYGLSLEDEAYTVVKRPTYLSGWGLQNGFGTEVKFDSPSDLLVIGNNVIIGDNYFLRKYNVDTGEVSTIPIFLTDLEDNYYGEDIRGIIYDGTYLYFTDYYNFGEDNQGCYIIRCEVPENCDGVFNGIVYAGNTEALGYDDGVGQEASFTEIKAMTTDGNFLYITDGTKFRQIDLATADVKTIDSSFVEPYGITNHNGKVYISDLSSNTISSFDVATSGFALFAEEKSLDMCHDGTYIYTTNGNKINKVLLADGTVSSFVGQDASGYADGTAADASFTAPESICASTSGFLFLPDTGNNLMRKIEILNEEVTTVAGGYYSQTKGEFYDKNPEMTTEQVKQFLCQTFEDNKETWGLTDVTDINLVWFEFIFQGNPYFTAFFYVGADGNADETIVIGEEE
jgi:hypothetical protein